jgi:hypothetical protein
MTRSGILLAGALATTKRRKASNTPVLAAKTLSTLQTGAIEKRAP